MDLMVSGMGLQWKVIIVEAQRANIQHLQARALIVCRRFLELKWVKSLIGKVKVGGGEGVLLSWWLEMRYLKVLIVSKWVTFQIVNHTQQKGKYRRLIKNIVVEFNADGEIFPLIFPCK